MDIAYSSVYAKSTKMYQTLKEKNCWSRMERDIADDLSICLISLQLKVERQEPF